MPGSATRAGVQLLIDVTVDADRTDPLDIARPWSKGDTVEHVDNGFVSGLVARLAADWVVSAGLDVARTAIVNGRTNGRNRFICVG